MSTFRRLRILVATLLVGLLAGAVASCGALEGAPPADPIDASSPEVLDGGPSAPTVDYLVVAADPLVASAGRFAAHRRETGHVAEVAVVSAILEKSASAATSDRTWATKAIKEHIKSRYDARDPKRPFFVLLLGDATPNGPLDGTEIPAGEYVGAETIVTDNVYADMDGDHIPDLALGRIPVATDGEADLVLEKTKTYESTYEVGTWNRRFNLFASTGGFGDAVDAQIEGLVFEIIEEIPYDYEATMTYAKQSSPFVFVPEKFSDKVYERMNEGSLMMAYLGHGDERGFATLTWNGATHPILDTAPLAQKIDVAHKSPLLTLIACLTGKFTEGESVSEQILKTKKGPVAILSSTEISHPYANALFIRELAQSLTITKLETVGEVFLDAKRRSITNDDALRNKIELLASFLLSTEEREELRRSHLYMYELFGDPALPIAYPRERAEVTAPAVAARGAEIAITVKLPNVGKGQALVTLEGRRSTITATIKPVPPDDDPTRDTIIAENYAAANDHAVVKKTISHEGASFSTTLAIPAALTAGDYFVRVHADDGKIDAVGSAKVTIGP
ncbi:MAG: hypothetical protein KF819_38340 [Labilithrix sp.]|nr:hypothetical protein [Labilithrix sp.]